MVRQKNKQFPLLRCRECGLVRMEQLPAPESATAKGTHPVLESFNPTLEWLKTQLILKPEIRRMKRYLKDKGPVLDVGCGTGRATSLWSSYGGMEVHGVEFQPAWAETARKRFGLHVLEGRFEEVEFPENTYSLVILRHVLEHFPDPAPVLTKVRSILKAGGYVLIMVPNGDSLGRRIFGSSWVWAPPAHIYTFSPPSLSQLLKKHEFVNIRVVHSPSPMLLSAGLHNWLLVHGKKNAAGFLHQGSLISNSFFFPLGLAGKFLGRGEVITVMAEKK